MTAVYKPCYTVYENSLPECVVCPENPAIPAQPAVYQTSASPIWNAGANSIAQLDGDVHVEFSVDTLPTGVYCGFKYSRLNVGVPGALSYAFYVFALNGAAAIQVAEGSKVFGSPQAYTLGDTLEIRRVNGQVAYYIAGVFQRVSTIPSVGPLIVSACLLTAGDSVT